MAVFYDGEYPVPLVSSISDFMEKPRCVQDYRSIDFLTRYMTGSYRDFIKTRQKELNIDGFFKKFFTINCAFSTNDQEWTNLKKVLKQTHLFIENVDQSFSEYQEYATFSYFHMTSSRFYKIKKEWSVFIKYIHDEKMKKDKQYSLNFKLSKF